jgi:hypothetical protein
VIIHEGNIVADYSTEIPTTKLEQTQRLFVRLPSPPPHALRVLGRLEGVTDVKDMGDGKLEISCKEGANRSAEISALAVAGGWPLLELRPIGMTL